MPIQLGDKKIANIFKGDTAIQKVFKGDTLVFDFAAFGEYEELADVNVTTATTQIDFTGLNITKADEVRLVYTFVGESTTVSLYAIRANDITSNYTLQLLEGVGSGVFAERETNSNFAFAASDRKNSGFADIKVSNNDRFVLQSQLIGFTGSNSSLIENRNRNIVNTSTVTSITKLSVVSSRTNGIAVGSRLQLYKVVK
jgi:hypothetical protein